MIAFLIGVIVGFVIAGLAVVVAVAWSIEQEEWPE